MRQLKYSEPSTLVDLSKTLVWLTSRRLVKIPRYRDVVYILLPLCALFLWAISLKGVDVRHMNDLGLASVFSPSIIIALLILTMSFCFALRQPEIRTSVLLLHLAILVFMLYGVTALVEEVPRFAVVYRWAGITDYISRTGSVDPTFDPYFNWPGFFILSAFVTRISGYHDILSYAAWAPTFFNLIYLGPLYIIFTTATTDKRLVWLGLWFFSLTNWVGQDSFLPQALNFFLYLVTLAILLKWFTIPSMVRSRKHRWQLVDHFPPVIQKLFGWLTAPDTLRLPAQPRQRAALLVILVLIFALIDFSHPLTPFFVLASVTALVVFRRCMPFWLPILMAIMTATWIIFMARPFLVGHVDLLLGSFGQVGDTVTSNFTDRLVPGSPEHHFITLVRVIMTGFIWVLALLGGFRRLFKGYQDVTFVLLTIAPFLLLVAQSYTGEMLLRVYLFSLPFMVFFAASLFYAAPTSATSRGVTAAVLSISLVLLVGFLFTRYGNERMDYMTTYEVKGVHYLYSIAPPNSLLLEGWYGAPLQFQDYEKYSIDSLDSVLPDAVTTKNVDAIVQFIDSQKPPHAYLIFTRSQKATADSAGVPPGTLDQLEKAILTSGKFQLLYSNSDAQIFFYLH